MVFRFLDSLDFIQPTSKNIPEVLIAKEQEENSIHNKEFFITKAVEYLKEDILQFANENEINDTDCWPPNIEMLKERNPPKTLTKFLTELLRPHRFVIPEKTTRLVDSYAADIIYGVTNGKIITAKHFLLSMGLHSLTGSRQVVDILNKLGHSMAYDLTCEIETSLAEKAEKLSINTTLLPLIPITNEQYSVLG